MNKNSQFRIEDYAKFLCILEVMDIVSDEFDKTSKDGINKDSVARMRYNLMRNLFKELKERYKAYEGGEYSKPISLKEDCMPSE